MKSLTVLGTSLMACLAFPALSGKTDTATAIFDPSLQTLKVSDPDNFMSPPVIRLGSDDRLVFSFDQLGYDREDLRASLTHCNSDWQPSNLLESEFLDGFNFEDIEDIGFSSNTFQHYTNYRIEIPSPNLVPIVSGNYLLQVCRREDPDNLLLQARFQVFDPKVRLGGSVTTRTDRGANSNWQQLSVSVDPGQYKILNPYSDLKLKITQNSDPSTARWLATPMRIEGTKLVYEHQPQLIFPALNEFRRFETIRATYPGMHTDSVRFEGTRYHAYLTEDTDRTDHEYLYDQTQKGRFLVREYNSTDSDLGADYVTVHFLLDFPQLIGADIYVEGEFTNYLHSEPYKMDYGFDDRKYHLALPLKQGSYNYRYTVVGSDGVSHPDTVEGNHHETSNEYQIEVWHRAPGQRADTLIGFATIN